MPRIPEVINIWRDGAGMVQTNLPGRRVVHHSPTGYEVGYGGSGPADLALNILDHIIPPGSDGKETVRCGDGHRVSATAWALHQDFKREVIARLPRAGGVRSVADIRAWLARHGELSDAEQAGLRAVRERVGSDEG